MNSNMSQKVAIIPIKSLGDSLVFTIIAQCISDMGMQATLYSNTLASMDTWFRDIKVKPFESIESIQNNLVEYDLVICDSEYKEVSDAIKNNKYIERNTIWITATRESAKELSNIDKERVIASKNFNKQVEFLSGSIRPENYKELNKSMVEMTQNFCIERFYFENAKSKPTLKIRNTLKHRKHKTRVAIFPLTPNPDKNYCFNNYLKIAYRLKTLSFEPILILTTEQAELYDEVIDRDRVNMITFNNINSLSEYIYESGAVISNDSGGGHLASLLDIPTATIYKKNGIFEWRPGWRQSKIIRPAFGFKWKRKRIWSLFVSKYKIINYIKNSIQQ